MGHPPTIKHDNHDPNDDGVGPETEDNYTVDVDWNNGCQNGPDDNEGECCEELAPLVVERPVHHNCTVRLWGNVPEVFEGNLDVRNPANEQYVLAEANGFLEFHGNDGTEYKVLWWDAELGHAESPITEFLCDGVITLYEPITLEDMGAL